MPITESEVTTKRIKPRLPRGMRDFLPGEMLKREYVFNIVRDVFHLYGFEPLQTPVLELSETLMGKYGDEAESLMYGAYHKGSKDKDKLLLRYDLTVPLARVVAQHYNDIALPFKRYHIAPVWRGEKPQRGRYREFYQCDADIVGIPDMVADAEIVSLVVTILRRLNFPQFRVKINNRKLLTAIGQYSGLENGQLSDLYRSVDKFDKVGADGVGEELYNRGIDKDVIGRMMPLLQAHQPGLENLDHLEASLGHLEVAQEGLRELRELVTYIEAAGIPSEYYEFDFTMVRGLGYYTGPIFETVIIDTDYGSISGGGRYDNLIGLFRGESLPTTGASLGIERIIDLMDELDLYPAHINNTVVDVLVTVFGDETRHEAVKLTAELREAGIKTELYMQDRNLRRQLTYANRKGIPFVVILGTDEIEQGIVTLKQFNNGDEMKIARDELADTIHARLT
ncbi:MAG: histidine--tRNA ligase [Chloroflexi bacterium]|nr:MAG: histidine--tRNA ligase [Phototrophicales bacterium]RMF81875.1 MAG: histidine--tRNA ligase [Chloroflexota bacterium]